MGMKFQISPDAFFQSKAYLHSFSFDLIYLWDVIQLFLSISVTGFQQDDVNLNSIITL